MDLAVRKSLHEQWLKDMEWKVTNEKFEELGFMLIKSKAEGDCLFDSMET